MFQGENLSISMLDNGFAELNFNASKGSVNVFNHLTLNELSEAVSLLENNQSIKGLLLSSGKGVFIAGADIREFDDPEVSGDESTLEYLSLGNNTFTRLAALPFPTVVAINGFALGGGFEICLACDYRVATPNAQVGIPEVKLGLIPGWGGTVRLPRLIGFDNAVEWLASGDHVRAQNALKVGAIDAIVAPDKLTEEALNLLAACAKGDLDYQERREQKQRPLQLNPTEMTMAASTCRAHVASKVGNNYPAPLVGVDVMIEAAGMNFEDALKVETQGFCKVIRTSQCRALKGVFLNDQFITGLAKQQSRLATKKIEHVAVLGAGIMGGGISYQNVLKGFPVLMKDINTESLDLGMTEANKLFNKRVNKGRLTSLQAGDALRKITPTLSYNGFEDRDIVIEAVVERPQIKEAVLKEVEGLIQKDGILVSNTSTISIDLLAKNLERPENFCGMHFFNPVHAMPLVEVIRGSKTSDETVAAVVGHALAMGKKPIVVNDCPGFLVNRVLFPGVFGFDRMVSDGADFQKIDKALHNWGWPMGPAYLIDVVGIDTTAHCLNIMSDGFPDRMIRNEKSPTRLMYENKRLGQKSGQGFYSYEKDKRGKRVKVVDETAYELLSGHVAPQIDISDEEIITRFMIPLCTEMVRCLEEGVVASPAEADMAVIYGLGFPLFRGGLFRWMDELGLQKICEMADEFAHLGALYEPTAKMREMAAKGETYYQ